ncbi:MAG: helix-turn-helix transcriptional regulator [Clostridiales bacterium]|nr:helix-turn-helix transcriptional regulator [Clostridiales bacterium]
MLDDAFYPFSRERKCEIIAYRLSQKGHYMPLYHSHSYYEFIFVMSEGKIVFSNTGGSIESNGRCVCFHNSHVLHRNNVPSDVFYDRIVLYCGESALAMLGGSVGDLGKFANVGSAVIDLDNNEMRIIEHYLNEIARENISNDKKLLYTALILTELKEYSNESNMRSLSPIKTYIKDVVEYIGLNYKNEITTPDLATRFFVSVNKLNRDFKRYTGSTIKQYLIALRMKYAQAMLAGGEGVRKTAEECGFESLSYFIQAFRQYTGQTPSAFSKKALGKFDYYT